MTASAATAAAAGTTNAASATSKISKNVCTQCPPPSTTSKVYPLRGPSPSQTLSALLKSQFERCRQSSIIRNDPLASDVLRRRIVPGQFGLVAEHEPSLFALKRPATVTQKVDMDEAFDETKFNFNKVKGDEEVLAVVEDGDGHSHRMLVNVSPLMFGHGLLVPYAEQCLPQQLTSDAINLAIRVLRRDINHQISRKHNKQTGPPADTFCIGFNSLGAFSSVNHLHLHILYPSELDHEARGERLFPDGQTNFPIVYASAKRVLTKNYLEHKCRVEELHWTVPCFSFQADEDESLSKSVASFVRYLHEQRIPHNVLFIQEKSEGISSGDKSKEIRCIVIPRQHQDHFDKEKHGFNAALGEISGMLIARTKEHFESFQEVKIIQQMQKYVACEGKDLTGIYEELQRLSLNKKPVR